MDKTAVIQLVIAVLSALQLGQFIRFIWARWRRDPKSKAQTRKIDAEAARIEWQTLHDEIARLNEHVETPCAKPSSRMLLSRFFLTKS